MKCGIFKNMIMKSINLKHVLKMNGYAHGNFLIKFSRLEK